MASSRWSRSPSDSFRTPNRTRSRLSGVPPPGQLRPSAQFSARSEEAASRSAGSNSASKRRRVSRLRGTIPRQKTTLSGTGRVCALRPLVPGPRCHHSVPLPPPRPPPSPVIPRLATPAPGRTARQRISRADRHRAAPSHGAGARGGVAGPRGRSANTEEPPVARGLHFDSRRGDDPWLERDPLRIAQAERDSDLPVGDPAVAADEVRMVEAFGAELRQRRRGDLLLDLAHELLDARRRARGLLALQGRERDLVLLVREVKTDAARNQQRAAHQAQDQQEVLAEELAAMQPRRRAGLPSRDRLHRFQDRPPSRPTVSLRPLRDRKSTRLNSSHQLN